MGGLDHFEFSYNHYLLIESSQRLPSVQALKKIMVALLGPNQMSKRPERRDLCQAYLKALAEGDNVFDVILNAPELNPEEMPEDSMLKEMALKKVGETPRLTKEQVQAIFSSPLSFWCHQWLLQTGRRKNLTELAKALKAPEDEVAHALQILVNHHIVEKNRTNKYRSKFWETDVFIPSPCFWENNKSPWLSREIDEIRQTKPSGKAGGNWQADLQF